MEKIKIIGDTYTPETKFRYYYIKNGSAKSKNLYLVSTGVKFHRYDNGIPTLIIAKTHSIYRDCKGNYYDVNFVKERY